VREAQVQPLLVVFEDLHWIDSETQALLDSLVESLPPARLLLFVNYRPEYEHHWGSKTSYTQLRLDPLPPESAVELLHGLLGADRTIEPLTPILIERTEGNPFFLEETVRALVETKALVGERGAYRLAKVLTEIQVPPTVQAILAARIDRLSPEDKRLLQSAAVIGKDVPLALLAAIVAEREEELRRGLAHLQAAEFLYEVNLFPDLEYTFTHALTHEVAYGSLLHERRRALHARIVDGLETLYRDHLGEQIERLAHHAVRGELRERAVPYLRQAGLRAAGRSALPDARAWFEQALEILASLPESQSTLEQAFDIRLELRLVLIQLGEVRRVLERLREAEILAERLNDDRRRGRVCALVTNTHSLLGELDEALAAGTRAWEIAERLGDLRLRIPATTYLEQVHYLRGDHERVVALATDNLAVLPAEWVSEKFGITAPPSVYDRGWLIRSLAELGRFAEAAEHETEAIRLAAAPSQSAFTVGWAHFAAGTVHLLRGDWAQARPLFEHATVVLRAGNVAVLLSASVVSSAWVLSQLGEASEALSRLREGEQLLERQAASGYVSLLRFLYPWLGRAALVRIAALRSGGLLQAEPPLSSRTDRLPRLHGGGLLGGQSRHGRVAAAPDRGARGGRRAPSRTACSVVPTSLPDSSVSFSKAQAHGTGLS
jgi:tetratricopeptide (TPR) repeat protein